ncbi:LacI family DNA-binding transcriptional regulator [Microbacterium sp.]|nr:LacI family DNA-binding transcriptional regulator [Microbacterium sp.]
MNAAAGRRPTLADVAALSGMSRAAVSMILNDRPGSRLSAEAAERVRAAAEELGYRPHPAAQSLRLGTTKTIGFISDEVTITRFASGMIRGVLDSAKAHDHTVLMAETGGDPESLRESVETMVDRRVDGIIVGLMVARMIDLPKVRHRVPLVVVNGTSSREHPSVLPAEREAGSAVARHLVEYGHRRIGIVGELPDVIADPRRTVTIGERFEGIDAVLAGAGIDAPRAPMQNWNPADAFTLATRMLESAPGLTALIAGNDRVAFGIYQAMAERGLKVAEDVSVISFDDEELADYQRPGLTTARLPYEEMARRGVEMLIGDRELAHERVPMPLIMRESVRELR